MGSTAGGCLCGAVRYTLARAPAEMDVCHCGMCRKHTGGLALGLMVPRDEVTWEGFEHVGLFRSSDWAERGFCRTCGSGLFYRTLGDGPGSDMISLGAGSLDDLDGVRLTTEIFVDFQPDGYAFAGDLKRMTQAEVEAAFGSEEDSA
ncbi:MAG: aldehyde-activating protein [Rhodobacteraceae bacterium]|nr:aldehyde-activating protein [Paracoccaceae bacterium]